MSESIYTLSITYRSNEHPFSTIHDPSPYPPKTDEEAIEWARGMREGMGGMYDITLLKNKEPMNIDEAADAN